MGNKRTLADKNKDTMTLDTDNNTGMKVVIRLTLEIYKFVVVSVRYRYLRLDHGGTKDPHSIPYIVITLGSNVLFNRISLNSSRNS
jgi:hypothetical protein